MQKKKKKYIGSTQAFNTRTSLHKSNIKIEENRKLNVSKHLYECNWSKFNPANIIPIISRHTFTHTHRKNKVCLRVTLDYGRQLIIYIYIHILLVRCDFHMTDSLSIEVHAFASRMLVSVSVDETLLPRSVTDKMKRSFFLAAVVSIPLYGCITWTLTKRIEKKLDGNYRWMLRVILNKSRRKYPTKQQLYGHLPPITKTIKVRWSRHARHCWRSKDELISDVLLWSPSHGRAKAGRPARTYIQQLCADTGFSLEDLPEAMDDREKWR